MDTILKKIRQSMQYHDRVSSDVAQKIICNYTHIIDLDRDGDIQIAKGAQPNDVKKFLTFIETFNIGFLIDITK